MKLVTTLTLEMRVMLKEMWHNHPIARCRQRAHAIFLSAQGFSIPQLAQIFDTERKAVSAWIDNWEALGVFGLYDKPRSGRPPILTAEEAVLVRDWVDEEPRQLKLAQTKIKENIGKSASCYTIKRVLKNSATSGNAVAAR